MSELILSRRKLFAGAGALLVSSLAAPSIVRAANLMALPVRRKRPAAYLFIAFGVRHPSGPYVREEFWLDEPSFAAAWREARQMGISATMIGGPVEAMNS